MEKSEWYNQSHRLVHHDQSAEPCCLHSQARRVHSILICTHWIGCFKFELFKMISLLLVNVVHYVSGFYVCHFFLCVDVAILLSCWAVKSLQWFVLNVVLLKVLCWGGGDLPTQLLTVWPSSSRFWCAINLFLYLTWALHWGQPTHWHK